MEEGGDVGGGEGFDGGFWHSWGRDGRDDVFAGKLAFDGVCPEAAEGDVVVEDGFGFASFGGGGGGGVGGDTMVGGDVFVAHLLEECFDVVDGDLVDGDGGVVEVG